MRIKCPECSAVLSFGQPKPGKYRPTCKHCQQPFRLQVSGDDPPKVAVGRLSNGVSSPASQPANPTVAGVEATMDASADPHAVTRADVSARTKDNTHSTVDATVAGDSQSGGSAGTARGKAIVSAGSAAAKSAAARSSPSGPSAAREPGTGIGEPGIKVSRGGSDELSEMPERLGGYRILRLLGRGAMGAVYEAQQISLDRLVALKTIRGRLANNPSSLARFTREAYAAAQLTHHNVVQIYDFGEDAGRHFFSMEWVRGGPLDELVRQQGALDPRLAAGLMLQAARGLQFAHRNGMVHRDIKPANLLLSDDGVVKVADLGLVKIPDQTETDSPGESSGGMESGTQVTMQGTAVGTPAYMAPEQATDAAAVDHRADIYSLGCTLFYLLAGRAPFDGSVASEVMEQHAKQPLPSLSGINARVPPPLEQIVRRAMAKRPDDRYGSLAEMIVDLESFLGVKAEGKFSPTTDQADRWEEIAARYASATTLLRLRAPLWWTLIAVSVMLTLAMPFAGLSWMLVGPALLVTALATALLLGTSVGRTAVIGLVRLWLASLSWIDLGVGLLGAVIALLVVVLAGLWPGMIVGAILGAIAGAGYHFGVILPAHRGSGDVLGDAERMIRDLRIEGADEVGVRLFAARYGGKRWQELFEVLFGYRSLCEIREQLRGDPSFAGSTSAGSLRDKVCANLSARAKANHQARDHRRLAKLEQRGLQSEGLSASDARQRGWQMASVIMDNAKVLAASDQSVAAAAEAKRQQIKAMLAEARSGKYKKKRDPLAPLRFALGGQTRLLLGCLLLAIFAIWGNNSGLFDSFKDLQQLKQLSEGNVALDELGSAVREAAAQSEPGTEVLGGRTTAWSVGIAGTLLILSAFVSGWRMTPFALLATTVILFGPSLGIPGFGNLLPPWVVSTLIGVVIYLPGVIWGESRQAD